MVKVEFGTGNAAFEDYLFEHEVSRIFEDLAEKVRNGRRDEIVISDINGNRIGSAWVSEDED